MAGFKQKECWEKGVGGMVDEGGLSVITLCVSSLWSMGSVGASWCVCVDSPTTTCSTELAPGDMVLLLATGWEVLGTGWAVLGVL